MLNLCDKDTIKSLKTLYTLIDDGKPDITSIATPNYMHFQQAMDALKKSHVIIEKPMCGSLVEADQLQVQAEKTGNQIFPVFQYRYADHTYFEDAIVIELARDRQYWKGWRGNWETALGGSLTLHGIHALDLFVARYGMPHAVNGRLFGAPSVTVETRGLVALQWRDGRVGTLGFAADSEVGHVAGVSMCPWHLGDPLMGYRNLFERISLNLIGTDHHVEVPQFDDGRRSIELLTAIYKSHLIGNWISLPVPSSDQFYNGWSNHVQGWYGSPEPPSLSIN